MVGIANMLPSLTSPPPSAAITPAPQPHHQLHKRSLATCGYISGDPGAFTPETLPNQTPQLIDGSQSTDMRRRVPVSHIDGGAGCGFCAMGLLQRNTMSG